MSAVTMMHSPLPCNLMGVTHVIHRSMTLSGGHQFRRLLTRGNVLHILLTVSHLPCQQYRVSRLLQLLLLLLSAPALLLSPMPWLSGVQ